MDWNDFFKSVKEGRFESVYLFTGPEELTKREALAALRRAILPAGLEQLNDATLEGVSAQAIIDAAETLPVMCERRIVMVRNWAPLLPGKAKNEEADVERMLEWLKNPPESCIVVFFMSVETDGRKKLPSALKKLPGYVEFAHLSGAPLQKWCAQQLKPLGKKISADAVNEMTMMVGQDLTRISGELKKLAAYTEDAPEITASDIRAVVSPSPEYSVFMILDHLLEGRITEATQVVNSTLQTEPSVIRIISLLGNQLRIDAHMKFALEARNPLPEVLKALNVSEYRARHIQRQIRSIPAEALKERYLACVEADYAIKSGRLKDRAALDALMLRLARN
ncbi:MAG: DNA polymerase III subunit delta [Clostridia bacterium]|nr:DNA polymerase III subunit delta [Clostridia bacterium]